MDLGCHLDTWNSICSRLLHENQQTIKIEALVAIAVCGLDNGHLCIFQLDTSAAKDDYIRSIASNCNGPFTS